ncbi:thermonuclease family protein [Salinibacterium sp. NSLL150]|uniref:thermonuclease family protein n=1 Tax=unclassified Salinibacterium TaxID=2632331 RepID=UPI0018CD09D5|nr:MULTISPECIES: thermonuclease family protein [unclassified Salinibacterium]MBH0099629.1 thermonuclease family protein [Salinibacterium sp. NSLL35]MBH0102383.1 thermonuclease family protein [Salinibacterium sp. NSLL150]MBH0105143.1 thermonuclease family protein [Salinibacterium sp. NSLL16]MBH0107903.1 thermonuclease family protein [Salinibacterium sp. NSLL17]MBH0110669.1 thermonuclease family protein [Salinibacterium sp. NG22]
MAASPHRPRTLGTLVVVVLVAVIAIATYFGNGTPGFTPNDSEIAGTPNSSNSAPESAPETADADAENTDAASATIGIPTDAFAATVNYVHDGDTLYLQNGSAELKVRLIGLDTPELSSQQNPDAEECYGIEARELLRDFLPEGTTVWAAEDREPEDRYGRSLLYVYLQDGTFVNLAMVELGAAEALKVGLNDHYWPELRDAEDDAYAAKLGMWGSC